MAGPLGLRSSEGVYEWAADVRYLGQSFEIAVPIDARSWRTAGGTFRRHAFHGVYEQIYGYTDEASAAGNPRCLRVGAIGLTPKPPLPHRCP